jgi:guanyl-specific ribonuclease Sa
MQRKFAPFLAIIPALIAVYISVWHKRAEPQMPRLTPAVVTSVAATSVETASVETAKPAASPLDALEASERVEVEKTLARIDGGGPFPHRQDGAVFSNRERRLPAQARGFYREYTVETPGASTRGARRIVRGTNGETYYSRDHYESFIRIDE